MGKKYNNSKSALILQKYTPEDIQKLLNSGKFKSEIARQLNIHLDGGVHKYAIARKYGCTHNAINRYMKEHIWGVSYLNERK